MCSRNIAGMKEYIPRSMKGKLYMWMTAAALEFHHMGNNYFVERLLQ